MQTSRPTDCSQKRDKNEPPFPRDEEDSLQRITRSVPSSASILEPESHSPNRLLEISEQKRKSAPPRKSQEQPRLERLPDDFEPDTFDVLCGKGKRVTEHVGYRRFISIVRKNMPAYSAAASKAEKSDIVTQILKEVLDVIPDGGFVKQDEDGVWYRLGEYARREKVGQILRDMLHTKYKSSNTVKNRKRKDLFTTVPEDLSEEKVASGVAKARRRTESESSDD